MHNKINHIAFIMDGNRRWAKKNNLINFFGYKKGIENMIEKAQVCIQKKIKFCTFFALSTENLKRDKIDIESLFLALKIVYEEKNIKNGKNFTLKVIGDLNLLPKKMKDFFEQIQKEHAQDNENNENITTVIMAVGYGSRYEISSTIKNILQDKIEKITNDKNINIANEIESIDEKYISDNLQTKDFPDPDILIRTSGINRLSNFLLWQLSYSEIFFIESLWPEFSNQEFEKILDDYTAIKRNFGK